MPRNTARPGKNTALRERAEKHLSQRPKTKQPLDDDPDRLIHELQVHQIELEMQNEALIDAGEKLEEALVKYADLYDFAPVGYVTFDANGIVRKLNLTSAGFLGFERSAVVGQPFVVFVKDEFRDTFHLHIGEVLNSAATKRCELVLRRKDGTFLHTKLESIGRDINGQREISSALSDITEHKRVEESLRESEERLSLALRATQEGIWDWKMGTNEVFYSTRWKTMLGYAEKEIEPHVSAWDRLLHPDDRDRARAVVAAVLQGERSYEMEFRLRHRDGHWVDILSRGFPIRREPGGPVVRIVGTHFDLTERKRADEELRRSKERYSMFSRSSYEGIFVSEKGIILDANDQMAQILGLDLPEIIGRDAFDFISPEYRESLRLHVLSGSESPQEVTLIRKDRSTLPIELRTKAHHTEKGIMRLTAIRDLTERKQAAAAIKENEQRFRAIFEKAPLGVALINSRTGQFELVNRKYCHIVGYTMEEMLNTRFQDITHPDDITPDLNNMRRLLSGDIDSFTMEKRYITKDGSIRWVNLDCVPLWDRTEAPHRHIAMVSDITDRMNMESDLRRKTVKLEKVNTTLQVLLEQRDVDKRQSEDKIARNIRELVLPFIESLQQTHLDETQRAYSEILKSNLANITSSFLERISKHLINLTPTEMKVAGLIKEGRSMKEISKILGMSLSAVNFHRQNLRNKLGISQQKINLRIKLLSYQ
jgi:PAS domain S-box-containing protein